MNGYLGAGINAVSSILGGAGLAGNNGTYIPPQHQQMGGRMRESDNRSEDINNWDPTEFRNFVKWFIEVNHPEVVKQYQAIRDIERQAEEAQRLEQEMAYAKHMEQYYKTQMHQAQNAYQYPVYTAPTLQEPPPKKSFLQKLGDWMDGK